MIDDSILRDEIKAWITRTLLGKGWSAERWAREGQVAATTITRFMKNPDASILTYRTIKKLADAAGVLPPAILPVPLTSDETKGALDELRRLTSRPSGVREPTAQYTNDGTLRLPVIGAVQAGSWVEAYQWPEDDWYYLSIPAPTHFPTARRFLLEVRGRSMDLEFPDRSVIECAAFEDLGFPPQNEDFVVATREAKDSLVEATVKKLVIDREDAWLWPCSTDPNFKPFQVAPHIDGARQIERVDVYALVLGTYRRMVRPRNR